VTRILRNSIFMALFNIFGRASGFIRYFLLVYFLSDSHYSLITYAFGVGRLARHFIDAGLDNLISREGARRYDDVPSYLFHGLLLKATLALIVFAAAFYYLASVRDYSFYELAVVYSVLCGSAMLSLTGVLRSCFTAIERMEYVFYTNLPVRLISIALLFGALGLSLPLVCVAWAISLENVMWFLVLGTIAYRFFSMKPVFSFSTVRYMIWEALPLALYGFFNVFYLSLDVLTIEYLMGKEAVAPYTYASLLVEGITMLVSGYFIAIYPVLSRYYKTDEAAYHKLFRLSVIVLFAVTIPVSVLLGLWSDGWVNIIKETSPVSGQVLRILAVTLNVSMLNTLIIIVFTSRNQQRWLVAFTGGAVAVSLYFNILFIGWFGQVGAAYASLLSQALLFVVMGGIAWRKFTLQFPLAKPVGILAVSLSAGFLTWSIPGIPLLVKPFIYGSVLILFAFVTGVLTLDEIQRFRSSMQSKSD